MMSAGGDGDCSCSGKKEMKVYFRFITFLGVRGVKPEGQMSLLLRWGNKRDGGVGYIADMAKS
jgi:hypothetical protein